MSIITQRVPYYAMVSILESCRAQLASVQELKKVRRTHDSECAYLPKYLRVLTKVFTRTYYREYVVLILVNTRTRCRGVVVEEPQRGDTFS